MIFRVCCVKSTYICRGKLPQDRICVAAGLNSLCFESLNGRKRMSVSLIPVFSKQYNPSLLCRSIQTVCVFSNPRMVNMRIAHLYPRSIDVFLSCLKKCSLHIPIFFFAAQKATFLVNSEVLIQVLTIVVTSLQVATCRKRRSSRTEGQRPQVRHVNETTTFKKGLYIWNHMCMYISISILI